MATKTLYDQYYDDIKSWDWDGIKQDAIANEQTDDEGNLIGCEFLGTVFALCPSGKYYTPFANSNVSEREAYRDEQWYNALEQVASEHDMYIFNGDGDPCDIFAGINIDS